MRRFLAALLASVMLVGTASAQGSSGARRVAIIAPLNVTTGGSPENTVPSSLTCARRDMRLLRDQLATMNSVEGEDFVVIPQANWKTEWARTGLFVWPNGTTEQFAGIIIPTYPGSVATGSGALYPNVRLDSLTRVYYNGGSDSAGVLVPHLYLLTNAVPVRRASAGADYLSLATAAIQCSTGVANGAVKTNPSFIQALYMTERPSVRWQMHTYAAGWPVTVSSVPGGIRKLLQASTPGYSFLKLGTGLVQSQWPDSLPFYSANNESTLVWDRLWANPTSYKATYRAKTMTFCDYLGGGLIDDSLVTNGVVGYYDGENESELSVLRFGLAHFDSLLGNVLFNGDAAVRAVVVRNAASRGLRRWMGGIAPGDTTAFYSSLDSLAAWGAPVTFALNVNPDTLSAYARDLIKLKSIGSARFTPYITDGVFDTTASLTATGTTRNKTRWVDVLGRWRNRVLVGPGTFGDSSLYSQLNYLRTFTDSVTGRTTVRIVVPPYDDWSPGVPTATNRFVAKSNSRLYADSTMYAMARAGFLGVLANAQSDECNLSVSGGVGYTNPRGFIGRQGWYRPKFSGTTTDGTTGVVSFAGATMDPFLVLGHAGGTMGMGKSQTIVWDDSSSAKTGGEFSYLHYTLDRANGSFFTRGKWMNQDDWKQFSQYYHPSFLSTYVNILLPMDDFQFNVPRPAYVLNLFCSDLSGDPANPARTGLHVIRSLQQSFYATNLAAGRTLVRLGYLDEVRP